MVLEGTVLKFVGDFKVLKTLANSGFSNVYLVEHNKTKQHYALKAIKNPNDKFPIQNEINILKTINHLPHILKLQKVFYDEKKLFFLYDLAKDGSLESYVQKAGVLSEDKILHIINSLLQLVKELHALNIIHQDIKPENILIHNNHYSFCDFGLASLNKEWLKLRHIKSDILFTAPEMYQGFANKSSDIYSLGATLFFLATGENVFELKKDDTMAYNMLAHCKLKLDFKTIKSNKIKYLIQRMMEKNYKKRASISELESILEDRVTNFDVIESNPNYAKEKKRNDLDIYEELCNHNIPFAQNNFASIYSKTNSKYAFDYFEKAAKNGLIIAFYNLGLCYKNGLGCKIDLKKSFECFKKAALENHESSLFMVGLFYECGVHVKKDLDKAYELYRTSAFHGNKKAYEKLHSPLFFKQN